MYEIAGVNLNIKSLSTEKETNHSDTDLANNNFIEWISAIAKFKRCIMQNMYHMLAIEEVFVN